MIRCSDFTFDRVLQSTPERQLYYVWNTMSRHGLVSPTFYDGGVTTSGDFIDFAKDQSRLFYLVGYKGVLQAAAWLDPIQPPRAYVHFTGLMGGPGITVGAGLAFCHTMLTPSVWPGPKVSVLLGVTPETNRLALRFIKRIGFLTVGAVPGALLAHDQPTGAVISYATLETVKEAVNLFNPNFLE